jgi:hypothetical protein
VDGTCCRTLFLVTQKLYFTTCLYLSPCESHKSNCFSCVFLLQFELKVRKPRVEFFIINYAKWEQGVEGIDHANQEAYKGFQAFALIWTARKMLKDFHWVSLRSVLRKYGRQRRSRYQRCVQLHRVFQRELNNGIANVTLWRVVGKRLYLMAYKLSNVQGFQRWIVCTPLSVNVLVTLATQ